MKKLIDYILLARPWQYLKNLFIFAPVFFGIKLTETQLLLNSVVAFILFCLVASSVYVINDLKDIEKDRQHPTKKNRPLAAGRINKGEAVIFAVILLLISLPASFIFNQQLALVLSSYFLLNLAYSLKFKHIAIVDVIIISVGFVMRIFAGSAVTGITLSMWVILMTFLISLFLALAKRRDDVLILAKTGKSMRKSIDGYNLEFINVSLSMLATTTLMAYIMYTVSAEVTSRFGSENLYMTSLFVILGLLRYFQVTFVFENSHSPTKVLLTDRVIQSAVVLWVITFAIIIY